MATPRHKSGRWTNAEDEILIRKVRAQELMSQPRDWSSIAAIISGRSNKDCRKRWLRLNGCIKRGEWSPNEDEELRLAVQQFGSRWVHVSRRLKTRSADQCAARWQNYLNPNIKRHQWSHEEDQRLLCAFYVHGSNWKMIQMHSLIDRSLQDIRNRHRSLSRLRNRSSVSPLMSSAINMSTVNRLIDRSQMPLYDMFSLNHLPYSPIEDTTCSNTDPSDSIVSTPLPAEYSNFESDNVISHQDIHEFDHLWAYLDVTTNSQPHTQSIDQLIHMAEPITYSIDDRYDREEMDVGATISETSSVVSFEAVDTHTLDLIMSAMVSNRASYK